MKVQLIRNCYVDGKACKAGDVVETNHGNLLIGSGKATKDIKEPKAKKAPANRKVEDIETR